MVLVSIFIVLMLFLKCFILLKLYFLICFLNV